MKKTLIAVLALSFSLLAFAQDDAAIQEKTWTVFSNDMPKGAVSTIKIQKKAGKIYEENYEEKEKFTPSAEDIKRGYAVYIKYFGEKVYPNMVPHKDELRDTIALSAVPGQYETGYPLVYPLTNLSSIIVTTGDLSCGDKKIPASAIEVNSVIYNFEPEGTGWMCRAQYMIKGGKAQGYKEIPRPFTVTVHVPESASAGDYTGKIRISAEGKVVEIGLTVTVLPFKFESFTDDNVFFAFVYTSGSTDPNYVEKMVANMKAHGMTAFHTAVNPDNIYDFKSTPTKVKVEALDKLGQVLKKNGIKKWIIESHPGPGIIQKLGCERYDKAFDAEYKNIIKQLKDAQEKNGWPQILMTYDEPREKEDDGTVGWRAWNDISNYARLHNEVGLELLPTYMSDSGGKRSDDPSKEADYSSIAATCKYSCTHGWNGSKKIMDLASKQGKVLMLYNNGWSRLAFGLLVLKYGSSGQAQFWWEDGHIGLQASDRLRTFTAVVVTADQEFVETLGYNESREGIDDYKYVYTLKKLLERAKDKDSTAALQADRVIKEVTSIKFADSNARGDEAWTTSPFAVEKYNGKALTEYRLKVITAILELKK